MAVVGAVSLAVGALSASPSAAAPSAGSVTGGIYTTDATRSVVNGNTQYTDANQVYLNGGPRTHGPSLADGTYFFAVLVPGAQQDPNDGGAGNLSTFDDAPDRSFISANGHILPNGTKTGHPISTAQVIQLAPFTPTTNPGGVYIVAVCRYVEELDGSVQEVSPSECKYDMFKIKNADDGTDPFAAPTADKTAVPAATVSYSWGIAKTRTSAAVITALSGTASYSVVATRSVSGRTWTVSGDINVYNTNEHTLPVTVSESGLTADDATTAPTSSCTLATGDDGVRTVPAKTADADYGTVAVAYTCTLNGDPGTHQFLNVASVAYLDDSNDSQTLPAYSDWFDFTGVTPTLGTGSEPATVSATDYFNGDTIGTALGTGTWDATAGTITWTYTRSVSSTAPTCQTIPNTAKIDGTTYQSSASVQICPPYITGGHTMGFWQNKNGQAAITANVGLCAYLSQYGNVLSDLPKSTTGAVCYVTSPNGVTAPVTGAQMATYVYNVIKAAAAAGDGALMFKGQFLATALDARILNLASTSFWVNPAASAALGYGGSSVCKTVATVLTAGNAQYATLAPNKAVFMSVKSMYDDINNNRVYAC